MSLSSKILRYEFEARIFVSLSIVAMACGISLLYFRRSPPVYESLAGLAGLESYAPLMFLFASAVMVVTTLLRMWSGSLLTSETVMSFRVQSDSLVISGPYLLVRNPIYFSDLVSLTTFSLFLPLPGIIIPVLFCIHYLRLIKYEEIAFKKIRTVGYSEYLGAVPKLFPSFKSFAAFIRSKPEIHLNRDGIRHNALYCLFVPGFIIGYFTGSFLHVALAGIAGVVDWAVIHTKIGLPTNNPEKKESKVFSKVLYSQCWEDPQIDREAFNIRKDDVLFSITSGGCNLLSFLLDDPKSVIALDLNPNQNHLLELKMAAFKYLPYVGMLEFIGVKKSGRRATIYKSLRNVLSPGAQAYWDDNSRHIRRGIIHSGRYEDYMKLLRICLRMIVSRKTIAGFFESDNSGQRRSLFEKKWNNRRWRLFTKVLLSRRTMSLLFDEAFFRYLDKDISFGEHFAEKARRALTELPVKENCFLRYILLGNYDENYLPLYLRKENFEIIRSRLSRIQIVNGNCYDYFKQLPANSISKFNFTNVFEWIPEEAFEELLEETVRVARNGAVITYRNLLVPREHPDSLSGKIESDIRLARRLHEKDLSFIYDNYIVETIIKDIYVEQSHQSVVC